MARRRKQHEEEPPRIERSEPYTPPEGEREGAAPPGFQATQDPAIEMGDQPMAEHPGASAHDQETAWDLDDPLATRPAIEHDRLGATFDPTEVGDETGDASSPRPDENVAEEIGAEVGVRYQDDEELHTVDKVAQRDEDRWELNPASSEDFEERNRERRGPGSAPPA